jgi:hypothetical protein
LFDAFTSTVTSLGAKLKAEAEQQDWAELLDSALSKGKAVASATTKAASNLIDKAANTDGGAVAASVMAKADGMASWVKSHVIAPTVSASTTAPAATSTAIEREEEKETSESRTAEDPAWAELR